MSKARDLADFISTGSILSDGTIESTEINGVTADASELNVLDGITVTTEELNNVAGISTSVQTQLDGKQDVVAGVSDTEIGYLDGVTSSLQTQLDNISVTSGSLTKSFTSGEIASITLAQAISPAPVVSATKEVPQVGISSKGTWDVNATASNYELHNTAYSTTLTPITSISAAPNLNDVSYTSSFSASGIQYVRDVVFNDDGTKMFILAENRGTGDTLTQYSLSTAYDITTATADGVTFNSSSDNSTRGVDFNADGTKLYIIGYEIDTVRQYSLGSAYDLSSVTYDNVTFSVASQDDVPSDFKWADSGAKFYVCGQSNSRIYQYNVTTAYDISTASFIQHIANPANSSVTPRGVHFSDDGLTMYFISQSGSNHYLYQYSLSSAFDISSTLTQEDTFDLSANTSGPYNFEIASDNIFVIDANAAAVRRYDFPVIVTDSLTLGTGSFASTDVGKRIQGNGGDVTLTSTAGAYDTTGGSAFTDSSTIASGSWSMRGLKSAGDADGIGMTGFTGAFNLSQSSLIASTNSGSDIQELFWKSDGTKFWTYSYSIIKEYSVTTAWSLSDGFTQVASQNLSGLETVGTGLYWQPDGSSFYIVGQGSDTVYRFPVAGGGGNWTIATGTGSPTSVNVSSAGTASNAVYFKPDGTRFFVAHESNNRISMWDMSTPWDVFGASNVGWRDGFSTTYVNGLHGISFSDDGSVLYTIANGTDYVAAWPLATAWNVATTVDKDNPDQFYDVSAQATDPRGLFVDGTNGLVFVSNGNDVHEYLAKELFQPTAQYNIAVTNSGGQIDSLTWTDINSMTADQAAGDGTVHYAVSTDDRTTWSVAKASDGVRPIVRDNAGTWQYNNASTYAGTTWVNGSTNDEFYTLQESLGNGIAEAAGTFSSLSNVTYDSVDFAVGSQDADPRGVAFSTDGTKMFVAGNSGDSIYQYTLSTAHDISTATYNSSFAAQGTNVLDVVFNSDGTKMYAPSVSPSPSSIYEYDLSTAFDITTVTYNSVSLNISSQSTGTVHGISFNDDGTKLYTAISGSSVYEYVLSTAYDLSTASYNNLVFNAQSQVSDISGVTFNSDGTKMFISDNGTDAVYQYSLNTPFSIGTVTYDNVSISLSSQDSDIEGVTFSSDFTKMYIAGSSNNKIYQYSTGLTVSNHNRMDKTQLDAVADGSHFTLGDTLDLAIALRQDTASASTPKSDGVSINYDAQALNQGAVLGTDYDYDFPDSTTVRVTSNATQNLKIRVV